MTEKPDRDHKPVMVEEVIKALNLDDALLQSQVRIIDATVGSGGHSVELVKRKAKVLGIDQDSEMLKYARSKLVKACPTLNGYDSKSFLLVHGNFRNIDTIAEKEGFLDVDGILLDLGISTRHYLERHKGFSFSDETSPLDMRLDRENQSVTAADLINCLNRVNLISLFSVCLPRNVSVEIADNTIVKRRIKKTETVGDFLDILKQTKRLKKKGSLHYATLPFLAVRIAVNSELENLKECLPKALRILKKKGRLIVISFHSGEDRIVKEFAESAKVEKKTKSVNKKPIVPGIKEIKYNPSARSAKMRIIEKI